MGGGSGQRRLYLTQDPLDISKHIVVPEAQDAVGAVFDEARPSGVRRSLCIVLAAVQSDDERCAAAGEIDNERANQRLAPKVRPGERDIVWPNRRQRTRSASVGCVRILRANCRWR